MAGRLGNGWEIRERSADCGEWRGKSGEWIESGFRVRRNGLGVSGECIRHLQQGRDSHRLATVGIWRVN